MPVSTPLPVADLSLDLHNYRTVQQRSEGAALHAMTTVKPARFWALTQSLLKPEGFLPSENIIVLRVGNDLVVKEGNRRIGALKLILGLIPKRGLVVPDEIEALLRQITVEWKQRNSSVPCAVYEASEAAQVDRIVALVHGLNQDAGRLDWNPVARARHNRDHGTSEPALDLLERYLKKGKNLSRTEAEIWSAEYHFSILDEAVQKLAKRLQFADTREFVDAYPDRLGKHRAAVESIVLLIGRGAVGFSHVRADDFGVAQGIPSQLPAPALLSDSTATIPAGEYPGATLPVGIRSIPPATSVVKKKAAAVPLNDPKSVRQVLRRFVPRGRGREKVAALVEEAATLKHEDHPFAFCFLFRALFEISAKAYCSDHGIPTTKNGNDRFLVDILNDVMNHVTKNGQDKEAKRRLHGPITELRSPSGLLSVTSMNQLVHSRSFSVSPDHISAVFHNVFPLLEEMNS